MSNGIEKNVTISVIIPVYNVEQYLGKCTRSVQNNTYKHLEIICINDGSTDRCGEILEEIANQDTRIKVISQENKGVAAARNAGLEAASGELIAFIDSDDFIHPRYFETMLRCMKQKNADIVVCGCRKFNEGETVDIPDYQHITYNRVRDRQFFDHYYARHMVWGRLYHKKDLSNIRFTEEIRMAEDTLYNIRVVSRIEKPVVYETNEELYYYRMRSNSAMHTEKAEQMIETGKWYLSDRVQEQAYAKDWSWMLSMQVLKATLSYRHTVRYVRRSDEQVKFANRILWAAYNDLRKNKKNSIIDLFILFIMIRSPWVYRVFRILQDPTMLAWEKEQKGKG